VQSEVLSEVTIDGLNANFKGLTAAKIAGLLRLVDAGKISGRQAKVVLAHMLRDDPNVEKDEDPADLVIKLGMQQVSDVDEIEAVCKRVLEANPKQAADLRAGKASLMGFFVGQVMKATGGSANPKVANEVLKKLLAEGSR
jgi:aspartyl-tRNA(Asn)/glutamyl-tRNA(Gln) amidotransferase subunit B